MNWIKIKSAFGTHKAGDLVQVTEAVAKAYIEAGLAEEADTVAEDALKNLGLAGLNASLKEFTDGLSKAIGEAATQIKKTNGTGTIEPGPQQADKMKSLGDFVKCARAAGQGNTRAAERLSKEYGAQFRENDTEKGMSESTGVDGGFWTVPEAFETQVMKVAAEEAVILPGATVVPMGAKGVSWPALDQYQAPENGNSAMYGGITVSRGSDTSKRPLTQAKAKKIKLEANDLIAMTSYSRDLNDDTSGSLSMMLTELIGGAIGFRRDWEHQFGSGEGQCMGYWMSQALLKIARGTAGTIGYKDLTKMLARLTPEAQKRAAWVTHPYHLETFLNLKDDSGRLIFIPTMTTGEGPAATNPAPRLLNLPVFFSEKAKAPGQLGDLALVDRKRYLVGQRSGLEISVSDHFMFDSDETAIRAKIRDDGQPQLIKPITLGDGAKNNMVSAFVGLDA